MVRTRRITFSGIRPPKLFSERIRCHIDPKVRCYDKTRCATCSIARDAKQSQLFTPAPTRKKRKRKTKTNPESGANVFVTATGIDINQQVLCAYCLYQAPIHKFLISTKKGYHRSQAKCPSCTNGQLIKTLTAEWTPKEYAEWIFDMVGYGFWQKIPFYEWRKRLSELGWAGEFWARYKELKAEHGMQETYEEVMNRQAIEQYEQEVPGE